MFYVDIPWTLPVKHKGRDFRLNLNDYRNAHYQVLASAKRTFNYLMMKELANIRHVCKFDCIQVDYLLYPKTKGRIDGNNIIAVVDKFFMDSLQDMGIISDDDVHHVKCYTWKYFLPDGNGPRIEAHVNNIEG